MCTDQVDLFEDLGGREIGRSGNRGKGRKADREIVKRDSGERRGGYTMPLCKGRAGAPHSCCAGKATRKESSD